MGGVHSRSATSVPRDSTVLQLTGGGQEGRTTFVGGLLLCKREERGEREKQEREVLVRLP